MPYISGRCIRERSFPNTTTTPVTSAQETPPSRQLTIKLILNTAVRTEVTKGENDKIENLAISREQPIKFFCH
jgi:hypothetical protein